MADATERLVSVKKRCESQQVNGIAWLNAKRDEIGLTLLAKLVGVMQPILRR
jgi:hypothetical protein